METNHVVELLMSSPFFGNLDQNAAQRVVASSEIRELESGATLYMQGEASAAAFVVLQGEILLRKGNAEVNRRRPPEIFGEVAVWDGGPRLVEAVATSPSAVLELPKPVLTSLLVYPGFAKRMLEQVVAVIRSEQLSSATASGD